MNEENLADAMDRILAERLLELPVQHPKGPRAVIHWAIRRFSKRDAEQPGAQPTAPWQWQIIARIRSLPTHVQEPLRRYFVFREAEESICLSIDITPREFRQFLKDAADYLLMRRERMPELEPRDPRDKRWRKDR